MGMETDLGIFELRLDRGWSESDVLRRYRQVGEPAGLRVRRVPGSGLKLASVDFLRGMPGLEFLDVQVPVADDRAAFVLPQLKTLTLLTGSRHTVPAALPSNLDVVVMWARPGLEALAQLGRLRRLVLGRWRGPDLSFLAGAPALEELRVEARYGTYALTGLASCDRLSEIWMSEMRVESLETLAPLRGLRKLWVTGKIGAPGGPRLDLSALSSMPLLEELRLLSAGSVVSLAPLLALTHLRDARFAGTAIMENDPAIVEELQKRLETLTFKYAFERD